VKPEVVAASDHDTVDVLQLPGPVRLYPLAVHERLRVDIVVDLLDEVVAQLGCFIPYERDLTVDRGDHDYVGKVDVDEFLVAADEDRAGRVFY